MIHFISLLLLPLFSLASNLMVGYGESDLTPPFEERPVGKNPNYKKGDPYFDTGKDRLYDFEEIGAFGADQMPGRAGIDDDQDGLIDNCSRKSCKEYLAKGSDDRKDPSGDNYDPARNREGTENNKKYDSIFLGGFGPYVPEPFAKRLAAGIHDPIWARAIAVQGSNGVPVVLVSLDLPGTTWKHINPIRRLVERELHIPASHVIIASTHNHSAPDAAGYWSTLQQGHDRYFGHWIRPPIYRAIKQAVDSLQSAHMKVATTTHFSCIDAKGGFLKKDPDCVLNPIRKGTLIAPTPQFTDIKDYDLPLIQNDLRDPVERNTQIVTASFYDDNNTPIVTFINWHQHPDMAKSSNVLISSDFVHYVRSYVESQLGGRAIYFSGTVGNQIGGSGAKFPLWSESGERIYEDAHPAFATSTWDKIRSTGFEIGSEVVKALHAATLSQTDTLVSVQTEPIDTQITNFVHQVGTAHVWQEDLKKEDRNHFYNPRCETRYGCVRSDLSIVRIGDLGLITAPGEMDPSYFFGRKEYVAHYKKKGKITFGAMPGILNYLPCAHWGVLGQANNYLSYMVHYTDNVGWANFKHPIWYEEFVTTDKNFGDDVGNKLMQMAGFYIRYSKRAIYPGISGRFLGSSVNASSVDVPLSAESESQSKSPSLRQPEHIESGNSFLAPFFIFKMGHRH